VRLWPRTRKGWARDLLIVAVRCVHARKENRFEVRARNITHIMLNSLEGIPNNGMSFLFEPLAARSDIEHAKIASRKRNFYSLDLWHFHS
ncbi:hypothetical protein, partial [Vibrio antiquarius]|uniref:hypothetical protein n=1 Tax=Vibrio antiquarius (strain Ex25) TaxID=150340 RepID=UPI00265A222B